MCLANSSPVLFWNTCHRGGILFSIYQWKEPALVKTKSAITDHLCLIGSGSVTHKKAMEVYKNKCKIESLEKQTAKNRFRVAIADLKLGAAAKHFETLLSLLASCGIHIGDIGHSRTNFNDIVYCLEKVINRKTREWLSAPLPSTCLPPHYWATVDKRTPSRVTNQSVSIVA